MDLTDDETAALDALARAWNAYLLLPIVHPDDQREFRQLIHAAEEKVAARPALRAWSGRHQ